MKYIMLVFSMIILIWILDFVKSKKFDNPFQIRQYIGLPGAGKSTIMTGDMYKGIKKGEIVWSDDPTVTVPGVNYYNSFDLRDNKIEWSGRKGEPMYKKYTIDPKTKERKAVIEEGPINEENKRLHIFIDEAGIVYDNRAFKNAFTPETLDFFKKHRHRRIKLTIGSQTVDVDKKIVNLTQKIYIVKRGIFRCWIVAKLVDKRIDIGNSTNPDGTDKGNGPVEVYTYAPFIFWKFRYLPKWVKLFNSFN